MTAADPANAAPPPRESFGARLAAHRLRWRQRIDLVALTVALCVALAVWIFIEVARLVTQGRTKSFDDWVVESLRNPANPGLPRGPVWFVEAVRDVSSLGSATVVALTLVAVAGYLALTKRYRALTISLLAAISGAGLSELLKHIFQRPRPPFPSALTHPFSSSFPSGHSMLSAMVYLLLGTMLARSESRWPLKLYFIAVAMALAFLVGVSRVILGVHYPSDVLGGWVAGLGWACGGWLASRWWDKASPLA